MMSKPPYQETMSGASTTKSHSGSTHVQSLQNEIQEYRPGGTIRAKSQRPKSPPKVTRIGLFGGPGVGKSALINSLLYATGTIWRNEAPEAYQTQKSMTMKRDAYYITEWVAICDNRGMTDFGGRHMTEVTQQLAGVRSDGSEVVWDRGFFARLSASLERARNAREDCKINCAVIVLSAAFLAMRPSDMKELVQTIVRMTGEHPIVVITHKQSVRNRSELDSFMAGLNELGIQYVHEIENYTRTRHGYDADKHVELLELLNECLLVADRVTKHAEDQGGCTIL